jgi:protein-disulfide isomerase
MRFRSLWVVPLLLLLGAAPALAEPLTPEQKSAVEQLIRDTLRDHPDIIVDALKKAQAQSEADAAESAKKNIAVMRDQLVANPHSPIGGNPAGDVTIVEFFDYRCPYCKQVEPTLQTLLKEDGKIRLVYKEFPILGPASVFAAKVALAARAQGKYDEFHHIMMAQKGNIDEAVVIRNATAVGLDLAALREAAAKPDIEAFIKENYTLAKALDIEGTPAFVIGGSLVPGVTDMNGLRQLVAAARKGG